jgi:hypothetical protein
MANAYGPVTQSVHRYIEQREDEDILPVSRGWLDFVTEDILHMIDKNDVNVDREQDVLLAVLTLWHLETTSQHPSFLAHQLASTLAIFQDACRVGVLYRRGHIRPLGKRSLFNPDLRWKPVGSTLEVV